MNIRNEMTMRGIADAEQLEELTRVLDDYCDHAGSRVTTRRGSASRVAS